MASKTGPVMYRYGEKPKKRHDSYWYQDRNGKWHWRVGADRMPRPARRPEKGERAEFGSKEDFKAAREKAAGKAEGGLGGSKFAKRVSKGLEAKYGGKGKAKSELLGSGLKKYQRFQESLRTLKKEDERGTKRSGRLSERLEGATDEERKAAIQAKLDKLTEEQTGRASEIEKAKKRRDKVEGVKEYREAKHKAYGHKDKTEAREAFKETKRPFNPEKVKPRGTSEFTRADDTREPTGTSDIKVSPRNSKLYEMAMKRRGKKKRVVNEA